MRRPPPAVSADLRKLLTQHASTPARPINLSQLLSFGRPLTAESVLRSVEYALPEITRRLAHRVINLERLPFIVTVNPYISSTLHAYRESFHLLATYPPVKSLYQNTDFTQELAHLTEKHSNDIPTMAKGFQESSRYMSSAQISDFLDKAIRNRVSVRLIAEQHIALSHALSQLEDHRASQIGVVDSRLSPAKVITMCSSFVSDLCEATYGASPPLVIDGFSEATFPYVPVHLEFIVTEILKNAFRATIEQHARNPTSDVIPAVTVTLSPAPKIPGIGVADSFFSIRVRDQGGGVPAENMDRVFSYAFTTAGRGASHTGGLEDDEGGGGGPYAAQQVGGSGVLGDDMGGGLFGEITSKGMQTGLGTLAGLGYGLPMSRLYTQYFGGTLELVSLQGWGSDVFLKLRCLEGGDSTI